MTVAQTEIQKKLSIIICYRDWGTERLRFAIEMHNRSASHIDMEVLISDYGSSDPSVAKAIADETGARVVYTTREEAPVWSRARALNVGVIAARGEYVITTDADILFSAQSYDAVCASLESKPELLLAQCRDLPESFTVADIQKILADAPAEFFSIMHRNATVRPRWGMGGLAAFRRSDFEKMRGYDERMEIYGAEDNDFAARMRKSGLPIAWLRNEDSNIYHIWHPPTRAALAGDKEAERALERNKQILQSDETVIRNIRARRGRFGPPLASIVIATKNRAAYVQEAIISSLMQTVDDVEVVVIDDGSTDDTLDKIREIDDPRLRVFSTESAGVSRARNFATEQAKGHYIVIMDDDDIMLPQRVESHFNVLSAKSHGSYGGWIDFMEGTGETIRISQGRPFNYDAVRYLGRCVIHPGLMIKRQLMQRYRYDENLKAGIDYNLVLRMAKAGLVLEPTRDIVLLKRNHPQSLTTNLSNTQKNSAIFVRNLLTQGDPAKSREDIKKMDAESKPVGCTNIKDPALEYSMPINVINLKLHAQLDRAHVPAVMKLAKSLKLSVQQSENMPGRIFGGDVKTDKATIELGDFDHILKKWKMASWFKDNNIEVSFSSTRIDAENAQSPAENPDQIIPVPANDSERDLFVNAATAAAIVKSMPQKLKGELPRTCILTFEADIKKIGNSSTRNYDLVSSGFFFANPDISKDKIFIFAPKNDDQKPDVVELLKDSAALKGCLLADEA